MFQINEVVRVDRQGYCPIHGYYQIFGLIKHKKKSEVLIGNENNEGLVRFWGKKSAKCMVLHFVPCCGHIKISEVWDLELKKSNRKVRKALSQLCKKCAMVILTPLLLGQCGGHLRTKDVCSKCRWK